MNVFNDAARQGQADAPASGLGCHARLEERVANVDTDARTVVFDDQCHHLPFPADHGIDSASSTAQRIDRVSDQRLNGPLEQDGVARHHRSRRGRVNREGDLVRVPREPRLEIVCDPSRQRSDPHALLAGRSADAFEPRCDAFEPVEIGS